MKLVAGCSGSCGGCDTALAHRVNSFLEQGLGLFVGATFLHICQVSLLRLVLGNNRRVVLVLAGWQTAAWAVLVLRDLFRLDGSGIGSAVLVTVDAVVGESYARRLEAAVSLSHWAGANARAADRVSSGAH